MSEELRDNIHWFDDVFEPDSDGSLSGDKENYQDIWSDDDWEDGDFESSIAAKYPGWYLVKMVGFTLHTFKTVEPWLVDNVKFGQYKQVGWDSGCSYSVGVIFESSRDAMMFKLRWR